MASFRENKSTCYLVSWNVAGFKTSLSHIERNTKKDGNMKAGAAGGFKAWLERIDADILW
jgi:hypothetical protein